MRIITSRSAARGEGRRGSSRSGHLARCVALGLALAGVTSAWAGPVGVTGRLQQPTSAADLGEVAKSIADVEQAMKSFEKRDFDTCVQLLVKAVKAHPELAPPHALLAKLAFLSNQGAMIRPALERAVAEDAEHPEVYILFGNLALVEGRLTDAAVHLEKAERAGDVAAVDGRAAASVRAALPSGQCVPGRSPGRLEGRAGGAGRLAGAGAGQRPRTVSAGQGAVRPGSARAGPCRSCSRPPRATRRSSRRRSPWVGYTPRAAT